MELLFLDTDLRSVLFLVFFLLMVKVRFWERTELILDLYVHKPLSGAV